MKNIFFALTLLLFACGSSNEDTSFQEPIKVPIAPTDLVGEVVSDLQIKLTWSDKSTNETGFKIERKTGTETYAIVGTTAKEITTFSDTGLTPGTTYVYRVYSYNSAGNSVTYSNELTQITNNTPTITTNAISLITSSTAISGGSIIGDGGATVTARGVCWSTNSNPTISLSTKTTNGSGTGTFTSSITGLTPNTTYYLRAYATNSLGTAYGNELMLKTNNTSTVTDIDGNVYQTTTICNQTWTTTNLNVTKYRNGDVIPQVTTQSAWASLTTGAWCYYNNDPSTETVYGKLYNWYAINDARGLAPDGYHIPTDAEWTILTSCLGENAGGKMKETSITYWENPNTGANNSSGFTGLPTGFRGDNGTFVSKGYFGYWWSSTVFNSTNAWSRGLQYNNSDVNRINVNKKTGVAVRCLRD